MTEENSYVVNNDGTITLQPDFLDLMKQYTTLNQMKNSSIVYLFINKDVPGIKFYNLKNNDGLKFTTKRNLVFEAQWNFLINFPNKSMVFKCDIGDIKITTYLLKEKELYRILNIINRESDFDRLITFEIKIKKM